MIKLKKLIVEKSKNPNFDWQRRQLDMHYQMFNAVPTNLHRQGLLLTSLNEMLSLMNQEGMKGDKEYKLLNKLSKDIQNVQKEMSRITPKINKLKNQMPVFRAIDSFKGK
jgi:predicted transcriptional regulator